MKNLINFPFKLRKKFYIGVLSSGSAGSLGLALFTTVPFVLELGLIYLINPSIFLCAERVFNPTDSKAIGDSLGSVMPYLILFIVNGVILAFDCFYLFTRKDRDYKGSLAGSVR
jgi:hypothetical protein